MNTKIIIQNPNNIIDHSNRYRLYIITKNLQLNQSLMNHEDNHYYEFIIKIHKCEMASLILCFCMALIHGSNTVVFGCPRAPLIHTIPKY